MDKKVTGKVNYNRGIRLNFEQIFGKNPWLWFVPFTGESGKPIGDGVVWTVLTNVVLDEVPGDEKEKRQSINVNEENKRVSEDGTARTNTAPDSVRSRVEIKSWGHQPESKVHSGKIMEKIFDEPLFSPESKDI